MYNFSDQGDGPPAKKAKIDDEDLQGGMAELVKAKVTEVWIRCQQKNLLGHIITFNTTYYIMHRTIVLLFD